MPIYEYQARNPEEGCKKCFGRFEVLQWPGEEPLRNCPDCGRAVVKVISWCRAAVVEDSSEHVKTLDRVKAYEREGLWSHAAELADKHAEKAKDKGLKMRALDNYKKAGYDADKLAKHAQMEND